MPEFHASLNAALARNSGPSAEDVEALRALLAALRYGSHTFTTHEMAERITASDWLAAHTAAAEARGVNDGIRLAARLVRDHVLGETGERVADFLIARATREAAARVEGGA